jgi:hypothetical protein
MINIKMSKKVFLMINRFKTAIMVLIHLLLLQGIYGQIPENMTEHLSKKFLAYCKSVPREEIYIHTDRSEYISGENLWFNIYLIDRQNFKPSLNSRIIYFELLNSENRPVVQKHVLIDKGSGPGQIVLPDTLSSGTYTIRAYTSWMKNFLPYNCFVEDITVYNILSPKRFNGKLISANIIKKGNDNNVIPEIKSTGLTLMVNNLGPDILEIIINADEKFRSENNNLFYIFIQTHGNINHVSSEKMIGETTRISLPKKLLGSGVNQITIFNSKGEPVGERFIYTQCKQDHYLTVNSVDSCGLRDKVTLEIEPGKEASAILNSSNLSISVAPVTNDSEIMDIDDFMVLGTEYEKAGQNTIIRRKIRELLPEVIDSILLNVRSNWIDWTAILSGKLPHFRYQMEKEDHFLLGKLVTSDQPSVRSGEFVSMCTPGKEAAFQYAKTDSEGNFRFTVHIDEELKDIIIMPDDIGKNRKIALESSFSDQYPQSEASEDSLTNSVPSYISKLSVNRQVQKIYGNPSTGSPLNSIFAPLKLTRFYGKPDIELVMADYISLPVMSEIFFELLPGVSLKKKKSMYEISITYRVEDDLFVTSPCLMIDGVIIKDPALIANLEPEIVEKIDVIKGKYLVGKYFFPGIINVITKTGDFNCVSLPDYMIRIPYKVIDPVNPFISPDYSLEEMKDSHIPDYRNTLYWNPSLKAEKNGKARVEFWSSDNKSNYIINIQGITEEGKPFSFKKILKVK